MALIRTFGLFTKLFKGISHTVNMQCFDFHYVAAFEQCFMTDYQLKSLKSKSASCNNRYSEGLFIYVGLTCKEQHISSPFVHVVNKSQSIHYTFLLDISNSLKI